VQVPADALFPRVPFALLPDSSPPVAGTVLARALQLQSPLFFRRSCCVCPTECNTLMRLQVVHEGCAVIASHPHTVCRWLSHVWAVPAHLVGPFIASLVQVHSSSALRSSAQFFPRSPSFRLLAMTVLSKTVSSASCAKRVRPATSTADD
jgi:hypothetical protein